MTPLLRPTRTLPILLFALAAMLIVVGMGLPNAPSPTVLLTSAQVSGGAALIATLLGTFLAVFVGRTTFALRGLIVGIAVAMAVVPLYVYVTAWQGLFGGGSFFTALDQPLFSGKWAVMSIYSAAGVPPVMLILLAALRWTNPAIEDAALLDGSRFQVLSKITIPLIFPAVMLAAAWVFVSCSTDNTVADLYQVFIATETLYTGINLGDPAGLILTGCVSIIGMLLMVVATAFTVGQWYYRRLSDADPQDGNQEGVQRRLPLPMWLSLAVSITVIVLFSSILFSLLLAAGRVTEETTAGWQSHWSILRALEIVGRVPWRYADEFAGSTVVAGGSATLALLVSFGLAVVVGYDQRRFRWTRNLTMPVLLLAAISLATPLPIIGLAMAQAFTWIDVPPIPYLYNETTVPAILAISFRLWPLCFLAAWYAVASVPRATLEAAALEGASVGQKITAVILPQRFHLLAATWLVAAIVAAGDVATSVLLVPPGSNTLAVRIFGLLHSGVNDELGGLCAFLLVIIMTVGWLAWWLLRKTVGAKS